MQPADCRPAVPTPVPGGYVENILTTCSAPTGVVGDIATKCNDGLGTIVTSASDISTSGYASVFSSDQAGGFTSGKALSSWESMGPWGTASTPRTLAFCVT